MKNTVTEKLISAVKSKARPAAGKEEIAFLRDFYHRLSGQDFAAAQALEFRAAALRHRKLGATREPGKTLIEIYNPRDNRSQSVDHRAVDHRDATLITIITDDKPFIIDSLTVKLNAMRKTPHRSTHPNFEVRRDGRHRMKSMTRFKGKQEKSQVGSVIESYIQYVVDFTPENEHKSLQRELHNVIADLEIVVKDWKKMRRNTLSLAEKIESLEQDSPLKEHGELLRWMENHNFAFLGYAEVEVSKTARQTSIDGKSVLGVLRAAHRRDSRRGNGYSAAGGARPIFAGGFHQSPATLDHSPRQLFRLHFDRPRIRCRRHRKQK